MALIEERLRQMGLKLPAQIQAPAGVKLPFPFVKVQGQRVLISGHGPLNEDGTLASPLGKLGGELTVEQGYLAAQRTGLAILASLRRALGDLDRIQSWTRIFGMINSSPGFTQQPLVLNGFSELILELYGADHGQHTRSAVGMAELPFNIPVEIEGEVQI
ncbi:MAG: RidA family protein [Burkholderiales bacterium]|jgi:enamine deaminase RidA (YjgF/YER057c/UK114 family)|nr:RidA family protein [Burkholderiales bacterium]